MKPVNFKKYHDDIIDFATSNNVDYIDAIVHYCEVHNIEIEFVADMIKKNSVIVSQLQIEAENLNILKKTDRLPV
jgi:hypothetical protein